jgi:CheY-like chemotaxis protein
VNVEYGLNVLVVDDDFLTRALMTRILTRLGCKVTTAENGEMAIDLILGMKGYGVPGASTPGKEIEVEFGKTVPENEVEHLVKSLGPAPQEIKFAVVFLDNQMPVMSGVKAVERLRELGRKDFVVGVTGNALLSGRCFCGSCYRDFFWLTGCCYCRPTGVPFGWC